MSETDRLLDEVRRENERRRAFIAGYGAAQSDLRDEEVSEMSKADFSDHIRTQFREFEDND